DSDNVSLQVLKSTSNASTSSTSSDCSPSQKILNFVISRQNFCNFDPVLVAPTLLFVAAKVEEWPIRTDIIVSNAAKISMSKRNRSLTHTHTLRVILGSHAAV